MIEAIYNKLKLELSVQENKVTFIHLHSNGITGNNRAIYEELKANPQYKIEHITLNEVKQEMYSNKEKSQIDYKIAYLLATSKYIILNDYYSVFSKIHLRPETELIQVWHGGGAFKKFGKHSLRNQANETALMKALNGHAQYSKVIVSCPEVVPIFAEALNIAQEKVLPLGLPRADVLYNKTYQNKVKSDFYKRFPSLEGKEIILYAPTYRDHNRKRENLGLNLTRFGDSLKSNQILLLKAHPFERGKIFIPSKYETSILNMSELEINDLLILSNCLITDYSSVIFEYAILNKPMIFYTPDLELYEKQVRGFYYPYEELVPGPIVLNEIDLLNTIHNGKYDLRKIEDFAKRFNGYHDGQATSRVLQEVFNIT